LVIDWRDWDYPDGKPMLDVMEAWRKKDKHLYEWEVNQKRKAVAWRNNLYRNWAAKLSRIYKYAKIENVDWGELKKDPEPQEEKGRIRPTEPRQIAAVGELLRCVKERFFETQQVKAAYTTRLCHKCGTLVKFDQVSEITATCSACGATWDQDDNAAENIIAS
jgi:hypothetical protein